MGPKGEILGRRLGLFNLPLVNFYTSTQKRTGGLLERASEPFCAPDVAEQERPAQCGWRGLSEVPFERRYGRDEFRSQATVRLTADQNGSGLSESRQLVRPIVDTLLVVC